MGALLWSVFAVIGLPPGSDLRVGADSAHQPLRLPIFRSGCNFSPSVKRFFGDAFEADSAKQKEREETSLKDNSLKKDRQQYVSGVRFIFRIFSSALVCAGFRCLLFTAAVLVVLLEFLQA